MMMVNWLTGQLVNWLIGQLVNCLLDDSLWIQTIDYGP